MINIHAEFYEGVAGKLFRLVRTPENIQAHIIYVAPLFEQANQTRHMQTRLALNAYEIGVESIIFDAYGCGDSSGELAQASLLIWQQDLISQITALKSNSTKPVYLSCLLSSALLLNEKIVSLVDGLVLLQPEFNGKRFVQQFKRLALASELTKKNVVASDATELEIAGYVVSKTLLAELNQQALAQFINVTKPAYWLEWCHKDEELPLSRAKQQALFSSINTPHVYTTIDDVKFWQSTELEISVKLIDFEQQTLQALLSDALGTKSTLRSVYDNQTQGSNKC